MKAKLLRRLSVLSAAAVFLLSACSTFKKDADSATLTLSTAIGYNEFLNLADKTYPNIDLELSTYAGANRTAYNWAQMQGDDIPDIFITNRILDTDLAAKRLVDLSDYDFVDDISDTILAQAAIDGGVYLLPVGNTMHGIYYNKTLMEENNWDVPTNFAELESLCDKIKAAGITPGIIGTKLHDDPFSAVFNLAKTDWFSSSEGAQWEQDFLSGNATAAGTWEDTMNYVQQYMDIGMFSADPQDQSNTDLILEEMGNRRIMFCTSMLDVSITKLPNGDALGMMPYLSKDGSKNVYIYSPASYIGINSHLTEPGNEKKLEAAIQLLSLLYSSEGQAAFMTERTPCALSVLNEDALSEDALTEDAQNAQSQGRIFPITYTHWENVLYDMGEAYKEWFRGEEGMDGPACITKMDLLQTSYLSYPESPDYCESTDNFTLEETGILAGKALGSTAGTDAAMVPIASFYKKGNDLNSGISGKLYKGMINADVITSISPGKDGEYAILTMTGAEARKLAKEGFNIADDKEPYPYILVTKGGAELEDDQTYRIAFLMESYTFEVGEKYNAQIEKGSFQTILREWLEEQQTVSPDGNPWE